MIRSPGEELAEWQGSKCCWQTVTSCVSQDSILRPGLLRIFMNNLDAGVTCLGSLLIILKLGAAVDSFEGQVALQRDLDRLNQCVMINWMKFN